MTVKMLYIPAKLTTVALINSSSLEDSIRSVLDRLSWFEQYA